MVTAKEQIQEIDRRLGRLKTEEATLKPAADIKLTRKLTLGRANIARQLAARRSQARGFLTQIGAERKSLLASRTEAQRISAENARIREQRRIVEQKLADVATAEKFVGSGRFPFGESKQVRKFFAEGIRLERLRKEFLQQQKQLEGFKEEGLEPIFREGRLVGFRDTSEEAKTFFVSSEQIGLIGAERLGRLEEKGLVEVAAEKVVRELPPEFITERPREEKVSVVRKFLGGDIQIPLITGVPGGKVTVRQLTEGLREVEIPITLFAGVPGGTLRTAFPSRVAAELIPTTPGEVAIISGLAGITAVAPPVGVAVVSGVIGTLGVATALSGELAAEQRVAGGIIGALGLAGVVTRVPIFRRRPAVEVIPRGRRVTPLERTFRRVADFERIPRVREIGVGRVLEAERITEATLGRRQRLEAEATLREISRVLTPELQRRRLTIQRVLQQERIRRATGRTLEAVIRARAERIAIEEILPETRRVALARVRRLEAARPKPRRPITFEIERPLVRRFDVIDIKPKKIKPLKVSIDPEFARLTKQKLDIVKLQPKRFDIPDIKPKKVKPVEVRPDPEFVRRVTERIKFEKAQPARFDIPGVPRQQLLLKRPVLKKPKRVRVLRVVPAELLGVQELALRRIRPRRVRARRVRAETIPIMREPEGIPRMVGGAGLTERQLLRATIREEALFRLRTRPLPRGAVQAEAFGRAELIRADIDIQAQRLAQPTALRQRTLFAERQRFRQLLLFC